MPKKLERHDKVKILNPPDAGYYAQVVNPCLDDEVEIQIRWYPGGGEISPIGRKFRQRRIEELSLE